MVEILIIHASTQRRIQEFNKAISEMKLKYDGKLRSGYNTPFPYKVEPWIYKMKKEVVPEFLAYVKGNTNEISVSPRTMQGIVNFMTNILYFMADMKRKIKQIKCFLKRQPMDKTPIYLQKPDMKSIQEAPRVIEGWGHSKVIGILPDAINILGEEEL